MGADFYQDDYGGGGYYDGGGGGGGYDIFTPDLFMESDIGAGSDFNYGYGAGLSPDYAPGYEPSSGEYYYDPSTGGVLDTGLWTGFDQSQAGGSDLFGAFFDYYSAQGYDDYTAMQLATQDASAGSIRTETTEQGPLPDLPQYFGLPYVPYDYWQSPPYIPSFPDLPAPAPPLPQSPATQQPNLPPACPGGQYHPYPIGHPQQNICVPFPQAITNQQQQRPPAQQSSGGASASRPPAQQQQQQQQCPSGYYRAPNGQCLPIPRCTTPGTIFDGARGICVPQGQAVSPLPSESEDLLSNLKGLPWWVWAALGGLFLLSRDSDGKTTTVRYRRAS